MTLVALANALLGDPMVERFHADPRVQATELLLQERVPRHAPIIAAAAGRGDARRRARRRRRAVRRFRSPHTPFPHAQFLSNGNYIDGRHQRRRRRQLLPRPRGDAHRDGRRRAIRAASSSTCATCAAARVWSATYHPTAAEPDDYLVDASARSGRRSAAATTSIATQLDIAVSHRGRRRGAPRSRSTNHERPHPRDRGHELRRDRPRRRRPTTSPTRRSASCSSRRSTSPRARRCSAAGARAIRRRAGAVGGARAEPRGPARRGRSSGRPTARASSAAGAAPDDPQALDGRALSGTTGVVLDPIVSLRQRIRLAPGGVRAPVLRHRHRADRARRRWRSPRSTTTRAPPRATFALAFTHAQSALRHLGISSDEALLFERLASRVLLRRRLAARGPGRSWRANTLGQAGLWPHGISGDLPILLVRVVERRTTCRSCGRSCRRRSTGG